MATRNAELTLELRPRFRFDLIDVTKKITEHYQDFFLAYPNSFYHSYHTTAGYLEPDVCAKLDHHPDSLQAFVKTFQVLFPPNADYRHDQLPLRTELTNEQRCQEPTNADSHLTFIGAGLTNSVTYRNTPNTPVYFIDLDGVYGQTRRRRQTTVIGFKREWTVFKTRFSVPVSRHPIDSVNLKDPRHGLLDKLKELLTQHGITQGRIDLTLAPDETDAGLTVNEYETLLMKHDLVDVLRNPLRFMAEKSRDIFRDPRAIPTKAKDYAKYDLVQLVNEFVETLGLSGSLMERIIDKFVAIPASHFLCMKRSVSLLVSDPKDTGLGCILRGSYQSPVLVQWKNATMGARFLDVSLVRFE